MAVFIRKVGISWWLEEREPRRSLTDRIEAGIKQFRDRAGGPPRSEAQLHRPSIYKADTREDQEIAMAAVAWNATKIVERIKKAHFVLLTDDDLITAGLTAERTPTDIPWRILRNRHFEIVRDGGPCSDEDLERLVRVLIERSAENSRFAKDALQRLARKHATKRFGLLTKIRDIIEATVRMIARSKQGS